MNLAAPLALIGLLAVPLIVAFYMLRLRRPERVVSSTFLWQQLVRDVEANAPWQRLRRSLLLLLQLLLAIALAFLVAQPFTERAAGLARDLVLVVDASASMASRDVFPDRLTAAKRAALEALRDLPSDGRVSVIASSTTAQVVANEATDRGRIARAVDSIEQSNGPGALSDALKLADRLAERARGAQVLVVTDDASAAAPDVRMTNPVRVLTVGRDRHNQAIVAVAVQADASGLKRSVFVSVANLDVERVDRRLQILADGAPFTARDLQLQPLSRADVVIDELPPGTEVVEARLTESAPGATPDQLALDDVAWAVVPEARLQRILLVGPGNVYLQNALSLLPNVELYGVTAAEYPTTTGRDLFDLIVFDGVLPPELPRKPILAIAPPATSALGTVSGTLEAPAVGAVPPDEPLLRNVDLSRLHVAEAKRMEAPPWARVVLPGPSGAPLLYSGVRDGLPTVVLAFDLRDSDLPLQVAWPILASNVAGELLDRDVENVKPVAPGAPVELSVPDGATGLRLTRPDGTATELAPASTGGRSVTFVGTAALGVYRVEAIRPSAASPSPTVATPSPTVAPSPSGSGAASPSSGGASRDPDRPVRFAVDLFDAEESNIAPGDGARLTALGSADDDPEPAGVARDEWWRPLAVFALVLLLIEWLVYERDGVRRLLGNARRGARIPSLRRTRA
jgi:hypothetical protein